MTPRRGSGPGWRVLYAAAVVSLLPACTTRAPDRHDPTLASEAALPFVESTAPDSGPNTPSQARPSPNSPRPSPAAADDDHSRTSAWSPSEASPEPASTADAGPPAYPGPDLTATDDLPGGRMAWSLWTGRRNELWLAEPPGADPVLVTAEGDPLNPEFSPGGDRLAFVDANGLSVRESDGRIRPLVDYSTDPVRVDYVASFAWSPDGRWIAFHVPTAECPWGYCHAKPRTGVWVVDVEDEQATPTRIALSGSGPTWAPSSDRIAFARGTDVVVSDRDGTQQRVLHAVEDGSPAHTWWSPDGSRIAVTVTRARPAESQIFPQSLRMIDAVGGDLIATTGPQAYIATVEWSPDGSRIAWTADEVGSNDTTYDPYVVNVSDAALASRHARFTPGYSADWSPDGAWLVVTTEQPGSATDHLVALLVDGRDEVWLGTGSYASWAP